ncbi:lipopolysaccharide assembly protein LapA domain-containing protein [Actinosynnema sp. NPDC020468]|uniref:LapA family protein n=1 Tax=Actinosynnema sp. NPDC020468 TaxID=3154488 RepID=UPI0033E32F18
MTTPRDQDRTDAIPVQQPPRQTDPPTSPPAVAPEPRAPGAPTTPDASSTPAKVRFKPTRISGTWVAVLASIVVLVFLLVFILQNLTDATVHFLGGAATLPLGVALLFGAIAGAILVALVGAARIMQLRRQAKRQL